jgi:hypothetical protein
MILFAKWSEKLCQQYKYKSCKQNFYLIEEKFFDLQWLLKKGGWCSLIYVEKFKRNNLYVKCHKCRLYNTQKNLITCSSNNSKRTRVYNHKI